MSTDSTPATPAPRKPRRGAYTGATMMRELRAYGARVNLRDKPCGEWADAEWDRLAELAVGAH